MDEFVGNEADGLLEWAEEVGVRVKFEEIDRYPTSISVLSRFEEDPPTITIFRYKPWEEWLQTICEERLRFFSPWYLIPLSLELYRYVESRGLYRHEPDWYDVLGWFTQQTVNGRAEAFTKKLLAIPHSPRRFVNAVDAALRAPGLG